MLHCYYNTMIIGLFVIFCLPDFYIVLSIFVDLLLFPFSFQLLLKSFLWLLLKAFIIGCWKFLTLSRNIIGDSWDKEKHFVTLLKYTVTVYLLALNSQHCTLSIVFLKNRLCFCSKALRDTVNTVCNCCNCWWKCALLLLSF